MEIEGKSYRVPKELKDMVLMHKDYTQKNASRCRPAAAVEEQAQAPETRQRLMSQTFEKGC